MGKQVSIPARNRARRISYFCDQLSMYVFARCIEENVEPVHVVNFMRAMEARVISDDEEYPLLELLQLLLDEDARESVYQGYRARIYRT